MRKTDRDRRAVKGAGGKAVVVVAAAADRCVAVAVSNEGELQMKEQS